MVDQATLQGFAGEIRESLIQERAVYARWEPGNGTAYEFVITPWEITAEHWNDAQPMFAPQGAPGWVFVARLFTAQVYPLRLWNVDGSPHLAHPSYFEEKFGNGSREDGCAIHLLFAAIVGEEAMCTFQDAGC